MRMIIVLTTLGVASANHSQHAANKKRADWPRLIMFSLFILVLFLIRSLRSTAH